MRDLDTSKMGTVECLSVRNCKESFEVVLTEVAVTSVKWRYEAAQHSMIWQDKFINVCEMLWCSDDHLGDAHEEIDISGVLAELSYSTLRL